MASICDIQNGFSISIVADEGDFQCIKIAAHELGHRLVIFAKLYKVNLYSKMSQS